MTVSTLPRVLRVVYPATVFAAALLSWSLAGHGVESASLFPHQKQPEFSFSRTLASVDTASCKMQDRLRILPSRQTCPDDELLGSWLGADQTYASQLTQSTKQMESHSASVN